MSSRVRFFACVLSIAAACSRPSPPPGQPPATSSPPCSTSAPAEGITFAEIVSVRSAGQDTGRMAELRRAAIARAETAARLVDTIVATPDTISLDAGESVRFMNLVRLSPRDSAGSPIQGMAPLITIADQNVARLERGEIIGVSVGRTVLRVQPVVPGGARGVRPQTRTAIPLVVRPGRTTARPDAPVDSVPRDLVVALLSGGVRPVSLRVEAPADGLSAALFRDSRVLGSAHVGNSATTAVIMPYSARVVLDTLESRLLADGWSKPRLPRNRMRGFMPARATMGGYGPGSGCRNGEYLSTAVRARSPNETLVIVSQQRTMGPYGPCGDSTSAVPRSPMEEFPVPLLFGPLDAELEPRGGGGTGDSWEIRALLRGAVPPSETLEHFASQLRKLNWTATDSSVTRSLAIQSFRLVEDSKRWLGVLSVVSPGDSLPRQVSFRIQRLDP